MNTKEIKESLQQDAPVLIREWFPDGKVYGGQYRVGSNLALCIEVGKKARLGMWYDHATGESGDIIGLWQYVNNCCFKDALSEIRAYLGIEEDFLLERKKDIRLRRQLKEITGSEMVPAIDLKISRDDDFWDWRDVDWKTPLKSWKGDSDHRAEIKTNGLSWFGNIW